MKSDATLAVNEMRDLVTRIRNVLPRGTTEKRMFGGTTFLLDGNMLCCASSKGLMVRVGRDAESDALSRPNAQPCLGTGRRMAGFIMVGFRGLSDDSDLFAWLAMAMNYVSSLPPKAPNVGHSLKPRRTASTNRRTRQTRR